MAWGMLEQITSELSPDTLSERVCVSIHSNSVQASSVCSEIWQIRSCTGDLGI